MRISPLRSFAAARIAPLASSHAARRVRTLFRYQPQLARTRSSAQPAERLNPGRTSVLLRGPRTDSIRNADHVKTQFRRRRQRQGPRSAQRTGINRSMRRLARSAVKSNRWVNSTNMHTARPVAREGVLNAPSPLLRRLLGLTPIDTTLANAEYRTPKPAPPADRRSRPATLLCERLAKTASPSAAWNATARYRAISTCCDAMEFPQRSGTKCLLRKVAPVQIAAVPHIAEITGLSITTMDAAPETRRAEAA